MFSKDDVGKAVSHPIYGNGTLWKIEGDRFYFEVVGGVTSSSAPLGFRLGHVDWNTDEKSWDEFFQNRGDSIGAPGVPSRTVKEGVIAALWGTDFEFLIPMLEQIEFIGPEEYVSPSRALTVQFMWLDTPQGDGFWNYMTRQLEEAGL